MLKYAVALMIIAALPGAARADREFSFNKSNDFNGAAVATIKIDMDCGEISIVKSTGSDIKIDFKNTVYARGESEANELNNDCKYSAEMSGDKLVVRVESPHSMRHGKSVLSRIINGDWHDGLYPLIKVSVPDNKAIEINSASADIAACEVTCDLNIRAASSDISLENTTGNVDCEVSSGDIDVTGHRGPVSLHGISSDLNLADIEGNLEAHTTSGDANLDKIKGTVQLSTSSGDCRVSDIDGNLDISSTSGDIAASGVTGSVRAEAISGDIQLTALSAAEGNFDVEAVSGDVQMELSKSFAGQVSVKSISGSVNSHLSDDLDNRGDSHLKGKLGDGRGQLNVSTTSGDINIDRF